MRNLLFLLILLKLTSCSQNSVEKKANILGERNNILQLTSADFKLTDINLDDFEIIGKGDTTYYVPQLYEAIYGKNILFDSSKFKAVNAKIKISFGFLQYTNDDTEAFPLEYTRDTEWKTLKVQKGKICIPDFNGNSKNQEVFEIFNFLDNNELNNWVASGNFTYLKSESIQAQTTFYQALLQNKKKFISCCPEYIKQAETFLKKDKNSLNSTKDLGIELFIKQIEISISGNLSNGEPFRREIVER